MPSITPSQETLDRRKVVEFGSERIYNVKNDDYPNIFPGESHSWSVQEFANNFRVEFHEAADPYDVTFSLIGLDASVANAFRRILIAEVPTLAIEDVYIEQNSSIVQDEILAQRLGLIPIRGNPEAIKSMGWYRKATEDMEASRMVDYNTVVMRLDIKCEWKPGMKAKYLRGGPEAEAMTPKDLYDHSEVYARDIEFQLVGRQSEWFSGSDALRTTNPDILITKMRPAQELKMTMHAYKGRGGDHAKFSPVATASYRLLPDIRILRPIVGADAKKFARCFPAGVISLEAITRKEARTAGSGYEGHEGEMKAVVSEPMRDTVSRECLRHEEFKDKVKLGRIRDHFIFKVESTGQFESEVLFVDSVKLLREKCERMQKALKVMMGEA